MVINQGISPSLYLQNIFSPSLPVPVLMLHEGQNNISIVSYLLLCFSLLLNTATIHHHHRLEQIQIQGASSSPFTAINPQHYILPIYGGRRDWARKDGACTNIQRNPSTESSQITAVVEATLNAPQKKPRGLFAGNLCSDRDHRKIYGPNFHVVIQIVNIKWLQD